MADIQNIKKPTNLPPITLAELNNYTEGNKDTYINQPKPFGINDGLIVNICADSINPNYIYYLKSSEFEMIGYIHTINRKRMIFLPFYRRDRHSSPWEVYIINYELDKKDFNSVDEIKALGLNKNPDFAEEQERKYRETIVNEENLADIKKQTQGTVYEAENKPKKFGYNNSSAEYVKLPNIAGWAENQIIKQQQQQQAEEQQQQLQQAEKQPQTVRDNNNYAGVEMAQKNKNRIETRLAKVRKDLVEEIESLDGPGENYEELTKEYFALKKELTELETRGDLGGRRRKSKKKSRRKSKRKTTRKYKRK